MRTTKLPALALAALIAPVLAAAPAQAAGKVWVSNAGADGAACGAVATPCRTLQQAHDNVAAGGEIGVLTPGDYTGIDPVVISKSVNITDDGSGEATLLRTLTIGAAAGDVVSVRGLVMEGLGVNGFGLLIARAAAVHVQNCVIRNFQGGVDPAGIIMGTGSNIQLFVSDTIVFNNGITDQSGGIVIVANSGFAGNAVLDRVHLENNVLGLWVDGSRATSGNGVHVIIRDSVVSGNAGDGIRATSLPGRAPAFVVAERTSLVNNAGLGLRADGPHATMLLDDNTVARNGVGMIAVSGGQLISYGNNRVNNNIGLDGTPTGHYSPL